MSDTSPVRLTFLSYPKEAVVNDSDLNARILALVRWELRDFAEFITREKAHPLRIDANDILLWLAMKARPPREPAQDVPQPGALVDAAELDAAMKLVAYFPEKWDGDHATLSSDKMFAFLKIRNALSALQARVRELEAACDRHMGDKRGMVNTWTDMRDAGFAEGVQAAEKAAYAHRDSDNARLRMAIRNLSPATPPAPDAAAISRCPHSDGNACEQYRLQGQRCQDCPLADAAAVREDARVEGLRHALALLERMGYGPRQDAYQHITAEIARLSPEGERT